MNFNSQDELNKHPLISEELHKQLFEAFEKDRLVVFLGAGVSALYGCQTWQELARSIAQRLSVEGVITAAQASVLKEEDDARRAISICSKIAFQVKKENVFFDVLKAGVQIQKEKEGGVEIYKKIMALEAKFYVTTNIDSGIRFFLSKTTGQTIYDCTDPSFPETIKLADSICRDGNIFHLHGTDAQIERAIFAIHQYGAHYQAESIQQFLQKEVFGKDTTVLFIGYGLKESEILQFMLPKGVNTGTKSQKFFSLTPLYSHDFTRHSLDEFYNDYFSLTSIPYFIDFEGYARLNTALDRLIEIRRQYLARTQILIDEVEKAFSGTTQ